MKRKLHTYEAAEVIVEYDAARCIHAKACVQGLPAVFDPTRRPWVAPDEASADAVADVVRRCPTGALHYRLGAGGEEQPPSRNEAEAVADGPLYLRGHFEMRLPDGEDLADTRIALCRCGASANKPFCDNTHADWFRDPATNVPSRLAEGDGDDRPVRISFAPNGPVLVDGPMVVCGADGSEAAGASGALCRCGRSETKPFCDGSHVAAGFEAD